VADTHDGGFSEETEDLLRRSEKSLQQGLLVCFAAFLGVHHVHKLLGGSLEVLQLLLPLLLLFAQHLDLLKAVDELLFSIGDYLLQPLDVICAAICSVSAITFCSLSTSSVRQYSILFTSVSSSSLYVKIFLSSVVKIFSEFKIHC
jgi:hypothetical protein